MAGPWFYLTTPFQNGIVQYNSLDEHLPRDVTCLVPTIHYPCDELIDGFQLKKMSK
jgi:hypothetical protein